MELIVVPTSASAKSYEYNTFLLILYIKLIKGNCSTYDKPVRRYAYFPAILLNEFR